MTEQELAVCTEAYEKYKNLSAAYLMRKLKCDKDHALKLIDEFLDTEYVKEADKK